METLEQEKRKYGSILDWNLKTSNNWNKIYLFVLHQHTDIPSVEGRRYPNSTSFPLRDQIFDKKEGKMRIIQVIPGEKSIFKDEQSEDGQNARPINKIFSSNGDLVVEAREDQTLDFMMKCNWNGSNPDRDKNTPIKFWLIDNKAGIETEMKKDMEEAQAANWCYTAEFKHIIRYARVLGFDTEVDGDQLRHGLRQLARKDPKKFNEGLKNKHTTRKFYVLDAVDKGIVTVDLKENTIKWANGNIITASPLGKHPVDHFVDLSTSNNVEFDMAYLAIQKEVEPTLKEEKEVVVEKKPDTIAKVAEGTLIIIDVNSTPETILDMCVKKGIVSQNHLWFTYGDKKYQKKKLLTEIETNATLKDTLIKACQ